MRVQAVRQGAICNRMPAGATRTIVVISTSAIYRYYPVTVFVDRARQNGDVASYRTLWQDAQARGCEPMRSPKVGENTLRCPKAVEDQGH